MEPQRVKNALARIEAAAARIEAAASRPRPAGDPELALRHARLRAAVGSSLQELDALIARMES